MIIPACPVNGVKEHLIFLLCLMRGARTSQFGNYPVFTLSSVNQGPHPSPFLIQKPATPDFFSVQRRSRPLTLVSHRHRGLPCLHATPSPTHLHVIAFPPHSMPLLTEPSHVLVLSMPSVRRGQPPSPRSRPPPCIALLLLDPDDFAFSASTSRATASVISLLGTHSSMVSTTPAYQVLKTLSEST